MIAITMWWRWIWSPSGQCHETLFTAMAGVADSVHPARLHLLHFAAPGTRNQGEDHHFLARHRADVVAQAQHRDAGDVLDHASISGRAVSISPWVFVATSNCRTNVGETASNLTRIRASREQIRSHIRNLDHNSRISRQLRNLSTSILCKRSTNATKIGSCVGRLDHGQVTSATGLLKSMPTSLSTVTGAQPSRFFFTNRQGGSS